MPNFNAKIINKCENGEVNLLVNRGNMADELSEYFAFNATIDNEGSVEFFFAEDEDCDIPDPIDDREQHIELQAMQDDALIISALKISLKEALIEFDRLVLDRNPDRHDFWFSFSS